MAEGGHIHYGSLEKGERERLSKLSQLEDETKRKLDKLKTQVVPKSTETHDLSEASQASIARQQELKEVIDRRKRARELAVPTNDNAVKLKLREYGEAIIIFGEQAPERRERLRDIMAQNMDLDAPVEEMRGAETIRDKQVHKKAAVRREEEPKQKELFYSEGTAALKEARLWLCRYSMGKAMERLEAERKQIEAQCNDVTSHESTQISLEGAMHRPHRPPPAPYTARTVHRPTPCTAHAVHRPCHAPRTPPTAHAILLVHVHVHVACAPPPRRRRNPRRLPRARRAAQRAEPALQLRRRPADLRRRLRARLGPLRHRLVVAHGEDLERARLQAGAAAAQLAHCHPIRARCHPTLHPLPMLHPFPVLHPSPMRYALTRSRR